jgi:hypothetical protein
MNNMIRNKKWLAAGFLLALLCSYMICITYFAHAHVINGQLVTHSHPYKGAPDNPGHSHTTAQFISIALLSYFVTLGVAFAGLACMLFGKLFIRKVFRTYFGQPLQLRPYALRAPPAW